MLIFEKYIEKFKSSFYLSIEIQEDLCFVNKIEIYNLKR